MINAFSQHLDFERKIMLLLLYFLLISSFLSGNNTQQFHNKEVQKKKIILFTSKGGAGHTIACKVLQEAFSDFYQIKIVNPFEEIIQDLDLVHTLTRKKMDGEKLYNYMLANGWIRTTNFMAKLFAPFMMRRNRPKIKKLMHTFLEHEKPDMVISVIPYLNLPASDEAYKLNIPYLIITLDGNLSNWGCMMRRHLHPHIKWTIGIDRTTTRELLNKLGFENKDIVYTGYPIRSDFTQSKDINSIKKEWKIPENKFTTMVLMGGAGGKETVKYVKSMYRQNLPIHVIACAGRNQKAADQLKGLQKKQLHSQMSLTIVPFTMKISDLMAVSQLLITKPGPGTINEALIMNLPMFLDRTGPTLYWERANIDFVVKNNLGKTVSNAKQFAQLLEKCVHDTNFYQDMKQAVLTYHKEPFIEKIKPILFSMCPPCTN